MAALTLLMIGILGVAPVFIASARSASVGMQRSRALALATRDIEAYRSVPYCSLGFSTGTAPEVVISNPAPGLPARTGAETLDGIRYTFTRSVQWVSTTNLKTSPATTNANAYKRVSVTVEWVLNARTNTVRQDSVIYPGGIGTYADSNCGVQGAQGLTAPPQAVVDLSAVTDGTDPQTSAVLSWSDPLSVNFETYRIVYSFDNFATSFLFADVPLTASRPYRVTGLAAGTTYQFQVLSVRTSTGEYTPSNRVSVSTVSDTASPCSINSVGLSPTGVKQASSGSTLESNVSASVQTSGSCSDLRLTYVADEGTDAKTILLLTQSGSLWTGTINGTTTNWSVGPHSIAVTDINDAVLDSSESLTICLQSATSCS